MADRFDRFTEQATLATSLAVAEAKQRRHPVDGDTGSGASELARKYRLNELLTGMLDL
jgi:hypothetical protein